MIPTHCQEKLSAVLVLVLLCISFADLRGQQQSPSAILELTRATADTVRTIAYRAVYRGKKLFGDTTSMTGWVFLEKTEKDTVAGCYIHILSNDTTTLFYRGGPLVIVRRSFRKVWKQEPRHLEPASFFKVASSELLAPYFLFNQHFQLAEAAGVTVNLEEDVEIDGRLCWHISFDFPVEKPVDAARRSWFVDKSNYLLVRTREWIEVEGAVQFKELTLAGASVNARGWRFPPALLPAGYQVGYLRPEAEASPTLAPGSLAPGFVYSDLRGRQDTFAEIEGKAFLLDFWYMACRPCIQAMPHLQNLFEQYGADGLQVIGLNPVDNRQGRREKLPGFLAQRNLTYPSFLVDRAVAKAFLVSGYPTLYLLDGQKRVVEVVEGFNEQVLKELEGKIKALLLDD